MTTIEVRGACPLDCPDCCSWVVTVTDGEAVKLRGAKDHPFTRGGLCTKMNPYLDYTASDDRILHPMRRVGAKGEGRFVRITWDEALDEWADRWRSIVDDHGGDAIWPYAGTGTLGFLQGIEGSGQRLFNALGLARHHPSICSVAAHVGLSYAMGTSATFDAEELPDAGLVVLWGANPLVSHQHLWPFVEAARANGAPIVCIDPFRTRSAQQADLHLAPRPGTDGALALGVMAELVERDGVDEVFVSQRSKGFDEFCATELSAWGVERAAEVCGIEAGEVRAFVDLIVAHRPLAIRLSMGMQRHAGGGQAARVIACLPALTGDHDRRGGGLTYSTSGQYRLNRAKLHRSDLRPTGTGRTLVMTRLADTLLDDDSVKSVLVFAANPAVSNPDQERVRRALSRDDLFTVAIDHVPTETTRYADLLLPSTTQVEQDEILISYGHLYLHWNEAAVAPRGEALPHSEMFRRLADRMGLDDPALFASDHELASDLLDTTHPSMADIDLDRLRREGWVRLGVGDALTEHGRRFPTGSGRFEFSSNKADREGHGIHPHYVPPAEATSTDDVFPFALITPAMSSALNSTFGKPDQEVVVVHPVDAEALSVNDGDEITVGNERGSFVATVSVSDATRPGLLTGTKGRVPGAENATVNATVDERDADMGAGAVYHDNRVWARR